MLNSHVVIVVVCGIPGSGKTMLARQLALALQWPLFSKDVIKERLFDEFGSGDVAWARQLGRAAFGVLFGLLRELQGSAMSRRISNAASRSASSRRSMSR